MGINLSQTDRECNSCELKSHLCSLLSSDELKLLNSSKVCVKYRQGEIIRKQGAQMTHVIIVYEGLAKMYIEGDNDHNAIIRIVKPANFIGGPGIYYDRLHHYSVAALTKATVCFIDVEIFTKLVEKNREFAHAFMKEFSINVISVYNRLIMLTQKQMYGKMAFVLIYLCDEIFQSHKFPISLTKEDLADLAGISHESAAKILREFKRSGMINWGRDVLELIDYNSIKKINQTG